MILMTFLTSALDLWKDDAKFAICIAIQSAILYGASDDAHEEVP